MPLPPIYHQVKRFLTSFEQELTMIERKTPVTEIEKQIENFITEIPRTFDDMEPLVRSLGVEIHKQCHLLKNDLLFWHAARQPETKAQRWQNIQQRLANEPRDNHDFRLDCSGGDWGVWEFFSAFDDWGTGYGISSLECPGILDVTPGRFVVTG